MKLLTTICVCSHHIDVYEVTSTELESLTGEEGNRGHFDPDAQAIFVDGSQAKDRKRDTFVHEVSHAFIEYSGLSVFLADSVKRGLDFLKWEEALICLAVPHLVDLLDFPALEDT